MVNNALQLTASEPIQIDQIGPNNAVKDDDPEYMNTLQQGEEFY